MNSESPIVVRRATLADLQALVDLERRCFAIPWSEKSIQADLMNPSTAYYWVAEQPGGPVIGYIACYRALDQAQINNLAVAPEARRLGVGGMLLSALLDWATVSGLAGVDLEVRPSNQPAIALYTRAGFSIVGKRRGYYADNGEDANIMLKKLP